MSSITLWAVLNKLKTEFVSNIKSFCIFGENGNEVIIITKNDKVFAFGDNKYGCLGLGHNNAVKELQIVKELCDQQIIDISYGYCHVLALTKTEKFFSWGSNYYGQLGNVTKTSENKPKLINALFNESVVQIACGNSHSLVLTKSGDLYGFGNIYGEIVCGNNTDQFIQIKITGFYSEKIVSITCGSNHSLVLTDVGNVYSWGSNRYGQLGLGHQKYKIRPQKIYLNNNEIIKSISCGQHHSLLLTADGNIYAFGYNNFGQIGNGNKRNSSIPVNIQFLSQKFKEIASNHLLNMSVSKSVDDYCNVWGQCENESFLTPQKTEFKSIDEIFALHSRNKITPKLQISLPINESKPLNATLEKMLKIFNNPKYSDMKFKIENKLIYVHKVIIGTNSKYFESKFTESTRAMRESTQNKIRDNIIEITEYSYDVYYAFLKYLYTDRIEIKPEKAIDLLALANDYKEEGLKLKCVHIIKTKITSENVCSLYCASIKYSFSEFEDFCFDFAVNKKNQILITEGFLQMDGNSMKKFMERAAKNNVFANNNNK